MADNDNTEIDPRIAALQKRAEAALHEIQNAIQFHEVWKPAFNDEQLHGRLDNSFAANAFIVIRTALRREMLLALMKIWDDTNGSICMKTIENTLGDGNLQKALILQSTRDRPAGRWSEGEPSEAEKMRIRQVTLERIAERTRADIGECIYMIAEYRTGEKHLVLLEMKRLRNSHIAHHQIKASERHIPQEEMGDLIESFYEDTQKLIKKLYSLTHRTAHDLEGLAKMTERYSAMFWAGVAGDQKQK
jgi:hypothetical protein